MTTFKTFAANIFNNGQKTLTGKLAKQSAAEIYMQSIQKAGNFKLSKAGKEYMDAVAARNPLTDEKMRAARALRKAGYLPQTWPSFMQMQRA